MGQAALAMGCSFALAVYKSKNEPVEDSDNDFDEEEASNSNVYMVICACDYKKTNNALTCSVDGRNMEALAQACNIPSENLIALYDDVDGACTKENVEQTIRELGEKCESGDSFIFYYSGHGTNMKDQSGDEEDGKDEAFCFVDEDGQISYESCMSDDDFAVMITEAIPTGVYMYVLTDCCHSGSICDFDKKSLWAGRKAVSITGCCDNQTSGDIGRGGIFTHSMMCAIGELEELDDDYSVAKLYNLTLEKDNEIFDSAQDIQLQMAPGVKPNQMHWPLIPQSPYTPPLEKRR